jgi:uncharacterized phage infection (PIP) family protein YhgE
VSDEKKPKEKFSLVNWIRTSAKEDFTDYITNARRSFLKQISETVFKFIFGAVVTGVGVAAIGAATYYVGGASIYQSIFGGEDSVKLRELVAGVSTTQSKIQSDIDGLQGAIARTSTSVTSLSSQLSVIAGTLQSVTTNQQRASDLIRQNADGLAKINVSIGDLKQSLGKFELGLTNLQSNTGQFEDELRKLEETNSKFSGLISK